VIRVVAFDAYGTLFDLGAAARRVVPDLARVPELAAS
jgi:hypothetical protein